MPADDVPQIQRVENRIAEAARVLAEKDAASEAPASAEPEAQAAPEAEAVAAETAPVAEAAPEATVASDDLYTERMADIARRQRDLDMRAHQLKNYERELGQLKALKEQVKADPIATLRDLGVDFYKLVEDNIGSGIIEKPAESKQDPKLEELNKTVGELKAALQRQHAEKQEAMAKDGIRNMVSSNPDRLKLIDKYGDEAVQLVFDRSLQEWNKTGRWDPASAALEVEEIFRDQARKDLERIKASGLFDEMFAGAKPKAPPPKPVKAPETQMPSELTRESPAPAGNRRLSKEERLLAATKFAEQNDLEI